MLDAGVVDTLDLALMPVLLGDGIPLFVSGLRPHGLVLRESRTHADGVVQLRYRCGRRDDRVQPTGARISVRISSGATSEGSLR